MGLFDVSKLMPLWDIKAFGVVSSLIFATGVAESVHLFRSTSVRRLPLCLRYAAHNFFPSFVLQSASPQLVCQAAGLDPEKYLRKYADPKANAKVLLRLKLLASLRCTLASFSMIAFAAFYTLELSEKQKRSKIAVLEGKSLPEAFHVQPSKNSPGVALRICNPSSFYSILQRQQKDPGLMWEGATIFPIILEDGVCRRWQDNPRIIKATHSGTVPVFFSIREDYEAESIKQLPASPTWTFQTQSGAEFYLLECDLMNGSEAQCPFKSEAVQRDQLQLLQKVLGPVQKAFPDVGRQPLIRVFLLDHFGAQQLQASRKMLPSTVSKHVEDIVVDGQAVILKSILIWAENFHSSLATQKMNRRRSDKGNPSKNWAKNYFSWDKFEKIGCLVQILLRNSVALLSGMRQISALASGSNKIIVFQTDSDQIFNEVSALLRKHGWSIIRSELASCFSPEATERFPTLFYFSCDRTTLNCAEHFMRKQAPELYGQNKSTEKSCKTAPASYCAILRRNLKNFDKSHPNTSDVCNLLELIQLQETYDGIFKFVRTKLNEGMIPSEVDSLLKRALN